MVLEMFLLVKVSFAKVPVLVLVLSKAHLVRVLVIDYRKGALRNDFRACRRLHPRQMLIDHFYHNRRTVLMGHSQNDSNRTVMVILPRRQLDRRRPYFALDRAIVQGFLVPYPFRVVKKFKQVVRHRKHEVLRRRRHRKHEVIRRRRNR